MIHIERYLMVLFYEGKTGQLKMPIDRRMVIGISNNGVISSVAQLCPTLCDSMDCSMPGLPVHHQLLEFIQTHVH